MSCVTDKFVATGMNDHELARRYEIGVDQVAWGNYFPHPEGTWPHTRDWLRIKFHDIAEDETRKMLGANALRCYRNFDVAKLTAMAERIGPSPAEIHVGLDHEPLPRWRERRVPVQPARHRDVGLLS